MNSPAVKRVAPPSVPIHIAPSLSVLSVRIRPVGSAGSLIVCVRRPSNFARPVSVPNHTAPSGVCAIARTRSEGRPLKRVTAPHWCKPVIGVGDGEGDGEGDGDGEACGSGSPVWAPEPENNTALNHKE